MTTIVRDLIDNKNFSVTDRDGNKVDMQKQELKEFLDSQEFTMAKVTFQNFTIRVYADLEVAECCFDDDPVTLRTEFDPESGDSFKEKLQKLIDGFLKRDGWMLTLEEKA